MQTKKSALSFCVFILPCFIAYVLSAAPHLPHARPQQDANALHRLAAHCHARRLTQSNLRVLQPPMSETTPGTEPPYPRFAARPKGVAAQRRVWGSQEGAREPYGALAPFCPSPWARRTPPVNTGTSAARRRQCIRHVMANIPRPGRACLACGGKPPERRNRFPSVEGKTKIASAPGREHFFHSPEGFSAMR